MFEVPAAAAAADIAAGTTSFSEITAVIQKFGNDFLEDAACAPVLDAAEEGKAVVADGEFASVASARSRAHFHRPPWLPPPTPRRAAPKLRSLRNPMLVPEPVGLVVPSYRPYSVPMP